jgi:hypothetical protein
LHIFFKVCLRTLFYDFIDLVHFGLFPVGFYERFGIHGFSP